MKKACFFVVLFFVIVRALFAQVVPGGIVDEVIDDYLSTPAAGHVKTVPVVVLRYLPTVDGINLDVSKATDYWDLGNITLSQLQSNIDTYLAGLKFSLEEGSKFHGYKNPAAVPYLGYKVLKFWTIYDQIPISSTYQIGTSGEDPVFEPDFIKVYNDFGLQQYIENNGVEEIWIWFGQCAMPGWPSYNPAIHLPENYVEFVESNMASPVTGDISNSHRFPYDVPIAEKTAVVYCYNFRRSQAEAVHNHGHQLESIYKYAAEQQDGNYNLFVHDFSGWGVNYSSPPLGRAGDCHHPPNTTDDYDYLNPTLVESDIEDWSPAVGPKKWINVDTWANLDYLWPAGLIFPQIIESQWYIYWMQNMPGYLSAIPYGSNFMTNWWQLTSDWDSCNNNDVGLYAAVLSNLQVGTATIVSGADKCYNATQTIAVAGSGTVFKVESGGTSIFIAGQKVQLLLGTRVLPGGYLHAYITTNSVFCGAAFQPISEREISGEMEQSAHPEYPETAGIKIYPNPTSGLLQVELPEFQAPETTFLTVYDLMGTPILRHIINRELKHQFSLEALSPGIYLVQVQYDGMSESLKVVKK